MALICENENNNRYIPLFLGLSLLIHLSAYLSTHYFAHTNLSEKTNKNSTVYMQIVVAPPRTAPVVQEKPKEIPKEVPKKIVPKKLVQEKPVKTTPAPLIEQPPEIIPKYRPTTNTPTTTTQTSTEAEISINALPEALVDVPARCPTPEIPITADAANAGITSGKVVLEVQISSEGKVVKAELLKGTGFQIDNEVVKLAKEMKCTPAIKDGKAVAVLRRLLWRIVR